MKTSEKTENTSSGRSIANNITISGIIHGGYITIQPKLSIGKHDDKYEQEADTVADQISNTTVNLSSPAQCSSCKEDEALQTKPLSQSNTAKSDRESHWIHDRINSTAGQGSPLPDQTRTFMENSFIADFSKVKIHNDSNAFQLNRKLNARAFTVGNDIYFNSGEFNERSSAGRHLLTHELTHVVQQGAAKTKDVQRNQEKLSFHAINTTSQASSIIQKTEDDKHNLTSTGLTGNPILEKVFDAEAIVKKSHIGDQVVKIQQALIELGIDLPGHGADSFYGAETEAAVIKFQKQAGMSENEWDGIVGRKTLGLLDKSLRNGAIETDPDSAENDFRVFDPKDEDTSCEGLPKEETCTADFISDINQAIDQSTVIVDKVIDEQLPPKDSDEAAFSRIYNTLFRHNDGREINASVQDVRSRFIETKNFMNALKSNPDLIRCGTDCDGGCRTGSPAYHTHSSDAPQPHIITFCPEFDTHDEKLLIVIHESHHAAVTGSRDFAYPSSRLIEVLDFNRAILNAASYHLYASAVNDPANISFGQPVDDLNTISDPGQKNKVDQVIAFVEHWFSLVPFDISQTISGAEEAKKDGSYSDNNSEIFMEQVFSKWFGLTKPPTPPTELDITKLKAIEERVVTMEEIFDHPFLISENAGPGNWINVIISVISLNPQTLSLDKQHLAIALLQELVNTTPNISAESEPLYVGTINDMRNLRNLDP